MNLPKKMMLEQKEKLVAELIALSGSPDYFAKTGEQFAGEEDCVIWTGLGSGWMGDEDMANYFTGYVHPLFAEWLQSRNLYYQWNDSATILVYEDKSEVSGLET